MLPRSKQRTPSTSSRLRLRDRFSRTRLSIRSTVLRERKATRTLGVILGAFIACWLPFFIVALAKPLRRAILSEEEEGNREESFVPPWLNSVFLWLGYANSFFNPIIYARFNRDFRGPFRDILLLRCRGINARQRLERYTEQYGEVSRNCNGFAAAGGSMREQTQSRNLANTAV